MRKPYNWALNDEGGIFFFRTGLHEYASTENMEFFTYINNRLRNLRKLPTKHKEDHSTLVRVRKMLFKARYLNLILPIRSNLNLRGPDIREGNIFGWWCYMCLFLFIDFTDIFNHSLDSCFFFVDKYEHFFTRICSVGSWTNICNWSTLNKEYMKTLWVVSKAI